MRHAAGSVQPTKCNAQRATCNMRQISCNIQRTQNDMQRTRYHATDNRQRATGNVQQTTWKRQQTACSGQHATRQQTPRSMRHAADGIHRAADSKQPATRNGQHATDNVQQTADDMPEDASTCEMRQPTRSTAVLCVRRAADGIQPAACAKHCMRQPVRNTAHTDAAHKMQHHHTTCAAAGTKSTRKRQHAAGHAMHEMRRTRCCRSPSPPGWIVGFRGKTQHDCPEAAVQTAGWVSARRSMISSVPAAPDHAAGAVCRRLLSRISPSSASNRSRKIRRLGCLGGPGWGRATLSRDVRLPRADPPTDRCT